MEFLPVWIGALLLQAVLACRALQRSWSSDEKRNDVALPLSIMVALMPLMSLLIYLRIFVIGGGSSIAQLAGPDGMRLWSLWVNLWPILALGNLGAFLALGILTCVPPYPPIGKLSWASRLCGVASAASACYVVYSTFPDA